MDYHKRAVELSQASSDAGEFPAGAVLVSRSGKVYESRPSLPYNHGESMVIDEAIAAEGAPLTGAVIYASMEPCLMCVSKMYWSGIEKATYVLPKSKVDARYAYENEADISAIASGFFRGVVMTHSAELEGEAFEIYAEWAKRISS